MQSRALLEALKAKLGAPIRYFCQVTHVGIEKSEPFSVPIILCLGEHSMFLLDQTMQELLGEVFYAHILRIVEQNKSSSGTEDVLRIEINDDRPKGIPAKVTVISSEKELLLKHLRCYWETDYMWRLSKIGVLRVDQEKIDLKKYKAKVKDMSSKEKYAYCSNSSQKDEQKGYCYFYPSFLEKSQLIGEFKGKEIVKEKDEEKMVDYFLRVKIEDTKQLEFIREDLRSKTETIAESLAESLVENMEEEKKESKDGYCFLKNAPYMKKMNIVVDLASWRGWEVLLKMKSLYISVIVLRRKFIPPLMDSGQDFIFFAYGGENARKISSEPADSIFTKGISNEYYTLILTQRCDALIMDEETANFYQLHLGIKPKSLKYAYRFIQSILKIINQESPKQEYTELLNEIKKIPEVDGNEKISPVKVIKEFMRLSKSTDKNSQGHMKWREKVCRYLAYALDGGLFYSRFTLEEVINSVMGGSLREIDNLSTLKKCIKQLLHVRKINEKSEKSSEDLYDPITNLLKDCFNKKGDSRKWSFNEKVMICLVESGYLQRELDISGDVNVYPNLLIYLLQSSWTSLELKGVICRVTVGIEEASELSVLKPLINHYIEIFSGKNYSLASQAAISLINLTYSNRENKQTLYKQRFNIIKRLNTKDQKLLAYTLMLITNLATEPSRRKTIATEIREAVTNIITGKVIDKAYLSGEVLGKAFTALIAIAKDYATLDYLLGNESFRLECKDHISKYDELIPKIVWIFELMSDKSNQFRKQFGPLYIPLILKKLTENLSLDIIKSLLTLLKALLGTAENVDIAGANGIVSILKQLSSNSEIRNEVPLVKLISSISKNELAKYNTKKK